MTPERRIMHSIHEEAMRSGAGEGLLCSPSVTRAFTEATTKSQV
jgi:hypothetical protein